MRIRPLTMPINRPFSFSSLPPVVRGLVVANAAVFLAQWFAGGRMVPLLGLVPARVLQDLWLWQVATYMFLHANFLHLLFNMYVLWAFGRELELRWGSGPFLWFYLICGWGAGVFNVLFSPSSLNPSIGASGAIYGLLVAFAMMFPEAVLLLYFLIPMKARHVVILFAALEFMLGFSGAGSGVANLAHLGGMVTGYVYLKSGSWNFRLPAFLRRRPKSQALQRKNRFHDLDAEVDRILDKILKQGLNSLTADEREVMRRYSQSKGPRA
jgi:membrane associated rhomboid family serine protease